MTSNSYFLDLADAALDPNAVLIELAELDPQIAQLVRRVLAVSQSICALQQFADSLPMIANVPHAPPVAEHAGPVLDLASVLEATERLPEDIRALIQAELLSLSTTARAHNGQVYEFGRVVAVCMIKLRSVLRDDRYRPVLGLMERLIDQQETREMEQPVPVPVAPEPEPLGVTDFELAITPVRAEPLRPWSSAPLNQATDDQAELLPELMEASELPEVPAELRWQFDLDGDDYALATAPTEVLDQPSASMDDDDALVFLDTDPATVNESRERIDTDELAFCDTDVFVPAVAVAANDQAEADVITMGARVRRLYWALSVVSCIAAVLILTFGLMTHRAEERAQGAQAEVIEAREQAKESAARAARPLRVHVEFDDGQTDDLWTLPATLQVRGQSLTISVATE